MKILHVIPTYEPAWASGGTVTATSMLCRTMASKGIEVSVYTTDADGAGGHHSSPLNEPLHLGGVEVWYFRCNLGVKQGFYSKGLADKLKETVHEFDLVHVAALWQWLQKTVAAICKERRIPYVVTPHSSLMRHAFHSVGNKWKKRFYWIFFGRRTIKGAEAIHFLCEGEREESRALSDSLSSFVVPNGIEPEKVLFSQEERWHLRKMLQVPESALALLFLGRIHPKKRIELVLRAIPNARAYGRQVFFIIAGPVDDTDYMSSLQRLCFELGIDSTAIWYGPVDNTQVTSFYSASDIMVLPSVVEGVSMALTEAMACSLPLLISNRVANYREVESDGAGIVVEPNLVSVRKGLERIYSNPELLQEMAQNARESVIKRYDIDKVASLMVQAYEDVVEGTRSPELKWK